MKSMRFTQSLRNNRSTEIKTAVDAGGGAAYINVYNVPTYPTNPGDTLSGETLLGKIHFSYPCGSVVSGELQFGAFSGELAYASGTPNLARVFTSGSAFVIDFTASGPTGSGGVRFNSDTITQGGPFQVLTAKITEGNN